MNRKLLLTIILVALGLPSLSAQKERESNRTANHSSNKVEKFPSDADVKAMLQKLVNDGRATGIVVGLLEANGKRRVISYGSPGPNRMPLDGDSVFEIGSISKVFTGILLADMVLRGEVSLEDPVAKYLPPGVHMPMWGERAITLLDLSTHDSGLPRSPTNLRPKDPSNPYADYTVQNLYDFLNEYKLPRSPGTQREYSNLGVGLLGHVLALKAGTSYEELVAQRIFRPLGMTHTAVTLTPEMQKHLVQGYSAFAEPVSRWDIPVLAGTGGIRSTANDMLRFAAANLSMKSGSPYDAMRFAHLPRTKMSPTMSIGLNWHISDPNKRVITFHNGGTGGYRTSIDLDKAAGRAVVVFTNTAVDLDIGFPLLDSSRHLGPSNVAILVAKTYRDAGLTRAIAVYREQKDKTPNAWIFNEDQLNTLGYWLLRQGHKDDALEIFKLNVEVYPNNSNLYDSLGEGYLAVGDREQAIKNYRRAVEIDPKNSNSIEVLKKLGAYP